MQPKAAKLARPAAKLSSKQLRSQLPTCPYFRVAYKPWYNAMMLRGHYIYEKKGSVLMFQTEREDAARARVGLWWNVIVPGNYSAKSTVRNWTRRRTREAFERALWQVGFDRGGVVRQGVSPAVPVAVAAGDAGDEDAGGQDDGVRSERVLLGDRDLRGTLALNILHPTMTATPDELLEASKRLIAGLAKLGRR